MTKEASLPGRIQEPSYLDAITSVISLAVLIGERWPYLGLMRPRVHCKWY